MCLVLWFCLPDSLPLVNCRLARKNTDLALQFLLLVCTWHFGQPANELARNSVQQGGALLTGVEAGIRLTESCRSVLASLIVSVTKLVRLLESNEPGVQSLWPEKLWR